MVQITAAFEVLLRAVIFFRNVCRFTVFVLVVFVLVLTEATLSAGSGDIRQLLKNCPLPHFSRHGNLLLLAC